MSIVPPEIVSPPAAGYIIDPVPSTSKLNDPSHSELHNQVSEAVASLHGRVTVVEENVNDLWPQVNQSRLAAHEWVIRGDLPNEPTTLLLPIIWNMTERQVLYSAAVATCYTAPVGQSIQVDIFNGTEITGELLDEDKVDSILSAPLEIPVGGYTSDWATRNGGGFVASGFQAVGSFLVAVVTQTGTVDGPGADLTIQLNRLL